MKRARYLLVAMLAAAATLPAGVVDVSNSQSVIVSGGDTLSFELFTGSYSVAAAQFGLPVEPAMLSFALVTAPLSGSQPFSATLRSSDSSIAIELSGSLDFTSGYYSSAGYQGAASALTGQFQFDPRFGSGPVWLDLTNLGGQVEIGQSPLLLNQDVYASLSGGALSVGAIDGSVLLTQARHSNARLAAGGVHLDNVPEPEPVWMLLGGGALLVGFSRISARFSRRRQ